MYRARRYVSLGLILSLGTIFLLLAGCGGGRKKPAPTTSSPPPSYGQNSSEAINSTLEEQLKKLEELEPPVGVDEGIFNQLKSALREELLRMGVSRFTSRPPSGTKNKVTDIELIREDGTYYLKWSYTNVGDYNQDKLVDIGDIAPLAEHFFHTSSAQGGVSTDSLDIVIDGNGDGTVDIGDISPLAENFFSNCSGYIIEGAQSLLEPWTQIDTVTFEQATGEGRLTFSYELASLDYQTYRVVPFDSDLALGEPSRDTLSSHSLDISGTVFWESGDPVDGATVIARSEDGSSAMETTTQADGSFSVPLAPIAFPTRVLIEATKVEPTTGLTVTNFQLSGEIEGSGMVDGLSVILPDPVGTELTVAGDQAASADGSVYVDGLPSEIDRVFARAYDPDESTELFPGEYEDQGLYALNSSVFLWITGTDTSGSQIDYLSSPATIRVEIPPTQWGDLTDILPNNGRIDVPIYDFNYETGQWESEVDGWLVDEGDNIIPEAVEPDITSGAFSGRIYAKFPADHFSYWNVDYPYIYVWTLSRISRNKRNNKCFYKALKLAETIAKSQKGKDAYAKVNKAGATIDSEYFTNGNPDNAGKKAPEIKTNDAMDWEKALPDGSITTTNGEYWGRVAGHRQDEFFLNGNMWSLCTSTSSDLQKKQAIILMASTILHEFAHQKQHVKKGEAETVEVGKRLEKDIFGGDIHYWSDDGLVLDGNPVNEAQLDTWLDKSTWSAGGGGSSLRDASQVGQSGLEIDISTNSPLYNTVESIYLNVTFRNGGTEPLQVAPEIVDMHYPLYIEVRDEANNLVEWTGPIPDIAFSSDFYQTLNPGEEISAMFDLRYDELSNRFRFDLFEPGNYTVKVVYSEYLPPYDPVESNTASFTVEEGPTGTINGTVTGDGAPIDGAIVYLASIAGLYQQTTTDATGFFEFSSVPQGNYVLGFAKSGYKPKMATAIVSPPDTTTVDAVLQTSTEVPTLSPVFDIAEPIVDPAVGTARFIGDLTDFSGSQIARALNGSFSLIPFEYAGGNYGSFDDLVILTTGDNGIRFYSANEYGFSVSNQYVVSWQPIGTIHFRATLTWDRPGDMDLHVQDPNGEHSYYNNKTIGTGFLDVDNTVAYGPENFTCITYFVNDEVVPGTYHVWVNYYSGNEPTNVTITLRANIGTINEDVVTVGPYLLDRGDWYAIDVNVDPTGFVTWTIPGTPPPST